MTNWRARTKWLEKARRKPTLAKWITDDDIALAKRVAERYAQLYGEATEERLRNKQPRSRRSNAAAKPGALARAPSSHQ